MATLVTPADNPRISITRKNLSFVSFVGLLLAEVLVLTYRFDVQSLVDGGHWWGRLAAYARYLPQALMVAGAVAALAYGGRAGLAAIQRVEAPRFGWSLAHLAAFAGFAVLTGAVLEGPYGRSPSAPAWFAAWLAAGVATAALWLAAILPADAWGGVARRSSGVLIGALAVGAAACYAGRLTGILWGPMHAATFWLVRGMLGLMFRNVVYVPAESVVGVGDFHVEIAPECSGYEGIGLIWVFLGAYLWAFRRELRFPQALWLLPAGTVVIWLANAVRIAVLVAIGARISPDVALGGFHSQAGWLAFNAVALGLVALSRRARVFAVEEPTIEPEDLAAPSSSANPTAAYLGPLLALVAAVMVTTAVSRGTGFDALYPVRVLAVGAALWGFRRAYAGMRWVWSWPAVGLGVAVFAVWMALEPAPLPGSDGLEAGLSRLPRSLALLWLAARLFGSVVTVPIAEELAFRGYLTRRLIDADFTNVAPGRFTWLSFFVSSFLFGGLHGRWLAGTLAGAIYAIALYRKGELSEAVLAHATTNALIAAYVLSTGAWSLWS